MTIQISTQKIRISQKLRQEIEDKIYKMTKFVKPLGAYVHINKNSHHKKGAIYEIEIHVHIPRKIIKAAEKAAFDIRSGVDSLEEKIKKQLVKYKEIEMKKSRIRRG